MLENHFVFDYGEQVRSNLAELPWFAANHLSLSFKKALGRGLADIRQEILSPSIAGRRSPPTQEFYDSTLIAIDAAIRFIHRYAETLRRVAGEAEGERAADPSRARGAPGDGRRLRPDRREAPRRLSARRSSSCG